MPPPGESRAPARAPAWSHSGSGRGGIPTARNPPRGETQKIPDFFHWFLRKNQKIFPAGRVKGLQPGLQPGATQDPGEEGFSRPETPHAGRPRVPDFGRAPFFDFFRFEKEEEMAFSKKIKKFIILIFFVFLLFRKNQKTKK